MPSSTSQPTSEVISTGQTFKTNQSMSKRSYADLLKTNEWQKKSAEIKQRDQWRCRDCGEKKFLNVHHCIYIRDCLPWEYPEWLLLSLCEKCHLIRQGREEMLHIAIAGLLSHIPVDHIETRGWQLLDGIYILEEKQ